MEFELEIAVQRNLLSQVQVSITMERMRNPNSCTYDYLIKKYSLSCPNVLITCFLRTSSGRYWAPEFKGGTDTYLSDLDIYIYIKKK